MKCGMRSKNTSKSCKTVDFKKGNGEFVFFAIFILVFMNVIILMISFAQISGSLNELTKGVNVAGRAVAVSRSQEDAEELASAVIERTVRESRHIHSAAVTVEKVDPEAEWESGCKVIVTVKADISALAPFTRRIRSKQVLVTVERIMEDMVFPLEGGPGPDNNTPTPGGPQLDGTHNISSLFQERRLGQGISPAPHGGTDFVGMMGDDVMACADGNVVFAENTVNIGGENVPESISYGNYVIIDHGDGLYTLYAHLRFGSVTVRAGDSVIAGDKIGEVGSTGNSTGPHLHLEFQYRQGLLSTTKLNALYFFGEELAEYADYVYEIRWATNRLSIAWPDSMHFSIPGDPRNMNFD